MGKVFRALIAKEKVFPFICCKFTIFESEYQASFPLLLLRNGSFSFCLKGFHPFLDIYLHTVAADPGRPLFFSCLLIFLVDFPLLYFAFSITFFAVLSLTVGRPLLGLS